MKAEEIEAVWRGRLLDVWNHEASVDLVAMEIRASLSAHANEALEAAAKMAHEWPLDVDRCVKALKIGANAKDWAVAFAYVADEIAASLRALKE